MQLRGDINRSLPPRCLIYSDFILYINKYVFIYIYKYVLLYMYLYIYRFVLIDLQAKNTMKEISYRFSLSFPTHIFFPFSFTQYHIYPTVYHQEGDK